MVLLSVLAGAALPCQAQESGKIQEIPPPKKEASLPVEAEPGCGLRVLWVDYFVTIPTLYAREYIREEAIGTWEVAYKDVDQVVTEMVLIPKDITREECYTCMEPVTTTDPVTGHCSTCMQPITKVRLVKDTVFEMAPKERTIKVPTAYIRPVKEKVLHKYDIYEWRYDNVLKGCAISVPGAMQPNTTSCAVAPMPPCKD
jgi:hypothetical protein